MIATISLS